MPSKNKIVKNKKPLRQQTKRVKNSKDPMGKFQWKRAGKTSVVWILIIIFAIVFSNLFTENARKEIEVDYFQYKEFLENKLISKADITLNIFHGKNYLTINTAEEGLLYMED